MIVSLCYRIYYGTSWMRSQMGKTYNYICMLFEKKIFFFYLVCIFSSMGGATQKVNSSTHTSEKE